MNVSRQSSSRWSPERARIVGFVGFIGCGFFGILIVVLSALGLTEYEPKTIGFAAIALAHIIPYAIMIALTVLLLDQYGSDFGKFGRWAVTVLGIAIGGTILGLALAVGVPNWAPGQVIVGVSFLAMHVLGTVVGVLLWRQTPLNRLAAGLFVVTIFMVLPAIVFDLPAGVIETPLVFGFAVLGYEFWQE